MTNITKSIKVIVLAVILSFGISYVFAWTAPTQAPTGGNDSKAPLNTSLLSQIKSGNLTLNALGITNTAVGALNVAGGAVFGRDIVVANGSGITLGGVRNTTWPSGGGGVPSGAIMFFNLSVCPLGWTEEVNARGRYIVGLTGGGTLANTVGTALLNLENRPVGQHNHVVASGPVAMGGSTGPIEVGVRQYTGFRSFATDNTGNVSGTNAPYIQFLVCRKN